MASDRDINGRFVLGSTPSTKVSIGTIKLRTRHSRNGICRAWMKVEEPNKWRLRSVVIWESANGPMPNGMLIHHKDGDTLNDSLGNLVLLSKAEHLAVHRLKWAVRATASWVAARRKLRWSTRCKQPGREAQWNDRDLALAVETYSRGGMSLTKISKQFGISRATLGRHVVAHT